MHWQQTGGGPGRGTVTCQSNDLGLVASLTWSCPPCVTVFLVKVIFLKPCRGTSRCTSSQARGPSLAAEEAAQGTCQSYDLGLAASLPWSCRSGITVLALQQYGDARCGPPTVCDWGPQQAGPDKGHRNNFKCSTSGLEVFSCYAAAMMFAMR